MDSYTPKNTRGRPHTAVFSTTSFWPAAYTIILLSLSTFLNTYICTPSLFSLGHGTSLIHIIIQIHTSTCICTLMDIHACRCMQMHVHYPTLGWLCMHMHPSASISVHMHADVYICIPTEDPLHGFHPSACMSVKIRACTCMCMQMDTSGRRWMTASIILFAIHRCMGCTWWRFTEYLQKAVCLCRCSVVHLSQWFGPPWVMIGVMTWMETLGAPKRCLNSFFSTRIAKQVVTRYWYTILSTL